MKYKEKDRKTPVSEKNQAGEELEDWYDNELIIIFPVYLSWLLGSR